MVRKDMAVKGNSEGKKAAQRYKEAEGFATRRV